MLTRVKMAGLKRFGSAAVLGLVGCLAAFSVSAAEPKAETGELAEAGKTAVSQCAETENMAPADLMKILTEERKFPEIHKDGSYVAIQDKKTLAMWTFTRDGQAAHPAVVCRVMLRDGDSITMDMVIKCDGPEKACAQLKYDFTMLNRRMQMELERKGGQ